MMAVLVFKAIRGSRAWLNGSMFLLSIFVWLSVSSNRNNILHAIGKLGIATKGYGSVNLRLLLIALCWSVVGCFVAAITYDVNVRIKRLAYLFLGVLVLVGVCWLARVSHFVFKKTP